jgi:4-hydroxy-tetrahydrodipicolinate reductase
LAIEVTEWANARESAKPSIVVHAGSGRELDAVIAFCERTHSTLVEVATGSAIEHREVRFPVVLCPNTNILMLKFMVMMARSGDLFKGYKIQLTESHQTAKTSTPGTAVGVAHSLGLPSTEIRSVRDPVEQSQVLGIPEEHLSRHAYHHLEIRDGETSITLETRVFDKTPYAAGVARIIAALHAHPLESRLYNVIEFIENGWL